ncbi:MAG TPA: S-methyl-5-thioribose-1-phosphate isomerase [Longimicrobiales bacterium]|nr:S-methyl-5-thioribose-1-phosphate isomerase [Longimicrobiales bacterium]
MPIDPAAPPATVPHPETLRWAPARDAVEILDQTQLPEVEVYLPIRSAEAMADAIRALRVRGAPAIGVAAALALALDAAQHAHLEPAAFRTRLHQAGELLAAARPTAVNLGWAVQRMRAVAAALEPGTAPGVVACRLWGEADAILAEDRAMCRAIGEHALALLATEQPRVLTHCNAGALATAGMGTALAPVYLAHAAGRRVHVFSSETRPLLQGSRITAWELRRAGIDVTVVTEGAVGALLAQQRVDAVLVGADRIAANGDVANKIGTYNLAVLARRHRVPFYVLAPSSTIDAAAADGSAIPIEQRAADEVRRGFGRLTAPAGVPVFAPAFDVTPAELIDAIVTDRGVFRPPYAFH